jgi:hypothetical protein
MNSGTVFAGIDFSITVTQCPKTVLATGTKSFCGS